MEFIITALPRSRTFWMATYLGWPHEPIHKLHNLKEFPNTNFVCTQAMRIYSTYTELFPEAKWIKIVRDIEEVKDSICRKVHDKNLEFPFSFIDMDNRLLEKIPAVLTIPFHELNDYGQQLHEVLHIPFNPEKWKYICEINIQVPELIAI